MGKSSFVNKVINDITPDKIKARLISSYLRIAVFLLIFSLIDTQIRNSSTSLSSAEMLRFFGVLIATWIFLSIRDPKRNNLISHEHRFHNSPSKWKRRLGAWLDNISKWKIQIFKKHWPIGRHLIISFKWLFSVGKSAVLMLTIDPSTSRASRWRILWHDIFLTLFVSLIAFLWTKNASIESTPGHYAFYVHFGHSLFILAILILFHFIYNNIAKSGHHLILPQVDPGQKKGIRYYLITRPSHYIASFVTWLSSLIISNIQKLRDRSKGFQKIPIRINLGYDDLQEIDVLRLVAKDINIRYREHLSSSLLFNVVKFLTLLFFVMITYYSGPFVQLSQNAKKELSVVKYFPSQGAFLLDTSLIPPSDGAYSPMQNIIDNREFNNIDTYLQILRSATPNADSVYFSWQEQDSSFLHHARQVTIYADTYLAMAYMSAKKHIGRTLEHTGLIGNFLSSSNRIFSKLDIPTQVTVKVLTDHPDYFFFFYFFFIWMLFKTLSRYRLFGIITHGVVRRKLKHLDDMLSAQVTVEKGYGVDSIMMTNPFPFFRRKSKTTTVADEREIEKQLINILDDISRIPRLFLPPAFIIVFDELDKIEPNENLSVLGKEAEASMSSIPSPDDPRGRRYRILKILSNLKHFLNTAKAKFIFIAGREMYDAALADVSDRNNFIGSVFHDVLYVNSFLTDFSDQNQTDVTSMCEAYVCQFILPRKYHKHGRTLKQYNVYLRDEILPGDSWLARARREKIIFTLKHFITFLTYRSNGAPKKLVQFFENYVVRTTKKNLKENLDILRAGKRSSSLYLAFDDFSQYSFGVITYIVNPFIFQIDRDIKDYGDKLLVSMSFLIDHLYKFHGKGFSWRNLELTPEIIDINKAPQLRGLIHDIIRHLSDTHIQQIVSGLYNFKFSKKIVEEVSFLSKISELESAAFNFTLDESLSIKRHYRRELQRLKDEHKQFLFKDDKYKYIHSVGYVHMILGDLHYYDEEYDLAITEYLEAIQLLDIITKPRAKPTNNSISPDLFVLQVRNELKLGLVFERKRTYDPAFTRYSKASSLITGFGSFANDEFKKILEDENAVSKATTPLKLSLKKHDWYQRASVLEGIRLIYQPLLSRLAVIEKSNLGGITSTDISRLRKEFNFLYENIKDPNKFLIEGEFKNKVGDILFFKNGPISKNVPSKPRLNKRAPEPSDSDDGPVYCWTSRAMCSTNARIKDDIFKQGSIAPCRACEFYMGGLKSLSRGFLSKSPTQLKPASDFENGELIPLLLNGLKRKGVTDDLGSTSTTVLTAIANALSDAGNTFLSCVSKQEKIRPRFWQLLDACLQATSEFSTKQHDDRVKAYEKFRKSNRDELISTAGTDADKVYDGLNKMEEIIFYYYLSALYFRRASEHKEFAYQLTKILYVIRDYFTIQLSPGTDSTIQELLPESLLGGKTIANDFLERIGEPVVTHAIQGNYRAHSNTHRQEIENYKHIFESNEVPDYLAHYVNLNSISPSADVSEIIISFEELRLRLQPFNNKLLKLSSTSSSAYSILNSVYIRIIQLRFKSRIYSKSFSYLNFDVLLEIANVYEALVTLQQENTSHSDDTLSKLVFHSSRAISWLTSEQRKFSNKKECFFGKEDIQDVDCATIIKAREERIDEALSILNDIHDAATSSDRIHSQHVKEFLGNCDIWINKNLNRASKKIIKWPDKAVDDCFKGNALHFMQFLISDAMFCLHSLISNHRVYGTSYMNTLSLLATSYAHLSTWCERYNRFRRLFGVFEQSHRKHNEKLQDIEEMVSRLFNKAESESLRYSYNAEMALLHYRNVRELHGEGKSYNQLLEKMFYLNDDLNDNHYHFSAASERFWLHSGYILSEIEKWTERLSHSNLYKLEYYSKND